MQVSSTWKLMFFGLIAVSVLLPLAAQTPPPPIVSVASAPGGPPPTKVQLNLLNQLQGIGDIKFGATKESLDPDGLAACASYDNDPGSTLIFQDPRTDRITWGTLHPSKLEFQFYYNQLVGIRLYFTEERGTLIAVNRMVWEKYGYIPLGDAHIPFSDGTSLTARVWNTPRIRMSVSLPDTLPLGATIDYLHQRVSGVVDFFDVELSDKLTHDKMNDVQQEFLKTHDFQGIKANL